MMRATQKDNTHIQLHHKFQKFHLIHTQLISATRFIPSAVCLCLVYVRIVSRVGKMSGTALSFTETRAQHSYADRVHAVTTYRVTVMVLYRIILC